MSKQVERSVFFDPADSPFEVFGFIEDLSNADTGKALGSRRVEVPDRPLGSPGLIEFYLTENVELEKGMKTVIVKASPKKPLRVTGMLIPLCGRVKKK